MSTAPSSQVHGVRTLEGILKKKEPVPRDQMVSCLRSLLRRELVLEAVTRMQVWLERLRPLPCKFDSVVDLSTHLETLPTMCWLQLDGKDREAYDRLIATTRDVIRESQAGDLARHQAREMAPLLGKTWYQPANVGFDSGAYPWDELFMQVTGAQNVFDARAAAMSMVSSGLGGGIRKLRDIVIKRELNSRLFDLVKAARFKMHELQRADHDVCYQVVAEQLNKSGLFASKLSPEQIFMNWSGSVEWFMKALITSCVPPDLA